MYLLPTCKYVSNASNHLPHSTYWRWQWEFVVLGLEEWSQFPASSDNCTAWYVFLDSFFVIIYSEKIYNTTECFIYITGSLDSEAAIYALCYDVTGTRLVSCEADKTIKMWKEDETATEQTHPLNFKPPKDIRRF